MGGERGEEAAESQKKLFVCGGLMMGDHRGGRAAVQPHSSFGLLPGTSLDWNTFDCKLFKNFGRLKPNQEHTIKNIWEFLQPIKVTRIY